MNIYLVDKDNKHAESLMLKLAEQGGKPGAMIALTGGEMELYCSPGFQVIITDRSNSPVNISKMEKGGSYVAVVKQDSVVIDDVINMGQRLEIDLAIIRTK